MKKPNNLLAAMRAASDAVAVDAVITARSEAVAEGVRRRDETLAERGDDGGDAA